MKASELLLMARPWVALSKRDKQEAGRHRYTCHAVQTAAAIWPRAPLETKLRVYGKIAAGLGLSLAASRYSANLEDWLDDRGVDLGPFDGYVFPLVQLHRIAWIDRMIAEFQSVND